MQIKDKKLKEVLTYLQNHSEQETCDNFGLAHESISRYKREARRRGLTLDLDQSSILKQIVEQYSDSELKAIAKGGRVMAGMDKVPVVGFTGQRIRIGAISDTHIGSIYTKPDFLFQAYEQFEKEGVEFVTHSGDVTEGMSNRAGHIYECSHLGYAAQKKEAIRLFRECPLPLFVISGNHDFWFMKSNGANIVQDVCDSIGATYLGHDEGNINLKGKATLKLWHGLDGNSYALSYRLQKLIESLTGGEKPSAIFAGHTHKAIYIFERFIHTYSIGSIQTQSKWARGKRIAFHTGFWIIDLIVGKNGIVKSSGTWYPFYS